MLLEIEIVVAMSQASMLLKKIVKLHTRDSSQFNSSELRWARKDNPNIKIFLCSEVRLNSELY